MSKVQHPKFLGSKGNFQVDIGADKIANKFYKIIVYSSEGNLGSIADVYGNSVKELWANATLFAASKQLLNAALAAYDRAENDSIGALSTKEIDALKAAIDAAIYIHK